MPDETSLCIGLCQEFLLSNNISLRLHVSLKFIGQWPVRTVALLGCGGMAVMTARRIAGLVQRVR